MKLSQCRGGPPGDGNVQTLCGWQLVEVGVGVCRGCAGFPGLLVVSRTFREGGSPGFAWLISPDQKVHRFIYESAFFGALVYYPVLAAGGGPHNMLICVFCRWFGFHHGVEGRLFCRGVWGFPGGRGPRVMPCPDCS